MKEGLKQLIEGKQLWSEPLLPEEQAQGFKGWYAPRHLPHFDSSGAQQFITYRLADSLPVQRRAEWEMLLKVEDNQEKRRKLETYLDRGLGACHLRDARIADLVQENLWYQDGVHYRLLAWVVMPNHVHVLIEVWQTPLGELLQAWKGYTSKVANRLLGRRGAFWAKDFFDRYLRDEEHFRRVVHYIEGNPVKAGLVRAAEDWPWSSAAYRIRSGPLRGSLTHPTASRVSPTT